MDPILTGEILSVLMLAVLTGALMMGFPVAFTIGGVAVLFAIAGIVTGVLDPSYLNAIPSRFYGILKNEALIAVPYFILMGMVLERSGIAADLITSMGRFLSRVRGGLGIAIIVVGTLLAACTGVVGATIVTLGLITLPTMLKAGYDKRLISGIVCCSGTLGTIIPPSVVLIVYGLAAQVSITKLFAASAVPGAPFHVPSTTAGMSAPLRRRKQSCAGETVSLGAATSCDVMYSMDVGQTCGFGDPAILSKDVDE